jgi:gamma-glutamyltranspeptidase/glutathione hydrolase
MPRRAVRLVAVLVALVAFATPCAAAPRPGAIATEHPFAAAAGAEILRAGGTVVDAAIATAAAIGVVHASSCGIGGGGFALVYQRDGLAWALDFRERAPMAATPDRFLDHGTPRPERTRTGGLAVGVPGEVAGWIALHDRFGSLPLAAVLAPAVRLARGGVRVRDVPHLAAEIAAKRDLLAADPGLAAVFLDHGAVPGPEFLIHRRALADTLERVATDGAAAFYRGPVAAAIVHAVRARGGVLSATDLATYVPVWRAPLVGSFRGRRIVTFPPPGSGAIVLTTLGIIANDDLLGRGRRSPAALELLASALARAYDDRARYYGDPAFTDVPLRMLLAPARLWRIREEIRGLAPRPRTPPFADAGTAHLSVVDTEGNAVALTTTINTAFGAGILVPEAGVVLNNEMDDFVIQPGVRNVYGLSGGAANVVAPGKRPQSSMSPTVVLAGTRPTLVVGASGGPFIVSATTQTILDHVVFGASPAEAIAAPRIHDQGAPTPLLLEPDVPAAARHHFARTGTRVATFPAIGAVSAVGLMPDGSPVAGADARKHGGVAIVPR